MSEFASSDSVERDGDIISGADYDSLEQELPDDHTEDIGGRAVRAASALIAPEPMVEKDARSEVEKRYDTAAELVDKRRDQGLDETAAWREADPTGAIQRDLRDEERRKQNELNHQKVGEIHQTRHDAMLVKIEQISDPKEREHARVEFLAHERVRDERRGRRA